MKNKLPHCNFRIAFQTKCTLINFFVFKERTPVFLHSGIVYEFQWGGCNATYYGKTKRHFKVRMSEHLGFSAITAKKVKVDTLREKCLNTDQKKLRIWILFTQ